MRLILDATIKPISRVSSLFVLTLLATAFVVGAARAADKTGNTSDANFYRDFVSRDFLLPSGEFLKWGSPISFLAQNVNETEAKDIEYISSRLMKIRGLKFGGPKNSHVNLLAVVTPNIRQELLNRRGIYRNFHSTEEALQTVINNANDDDKCLVRWAGSGNKILAAYIIAKRDSGISRSTLCIAQGIVTTLGIDTNFDSEIESIMSSKNNITIYDNDIEKISILYNDNTKINYIINLIKK